jgi:transcriptional regulator GlxA family with amidase domain
MIDADFSPETALAVARRHVVFRTRPGGRGQFALDAAVHEGVDDKRLSGLLERIATDPRVDWCAETMAGEAGVSLRTLDRLFRDQMSATPAEIVDKMRVDRARRALLIGMPPIPRIPAS